MNGSPARAPQRRRSWRHRLGGLLALSLLLVTATTLTGCGNMKPDDFADAEPKLVLEEYFPGKTYAWGIFVDRFGNLRRQFQVEIDGTWDGTTLTLDEHFDYADGEKDRRVWRITRTGENTYEGRADDIIGVANGTIAGNALNWSYDMNLKVGDSTWKVHFNDWMWLQPGDVLINRATVTRWGFELGTVTLFFTKTPRNAPPAAATDAPS
ncbi:DUF3833 family protein [Roseospira navarrensis]|uniref:DUF3833 family protein n=2 Tax=Roseospira navarrensis TaxID=140058 RepID=A0A7X2D3A5_9PROT|nr:DUF3833 family protein [Roseospira navarrensis]